jgi:hypothetical protein
MLPGRRRPRPCSGSGARGPCPRRLFGFHPTGGVTVRLGFPWTLPVCFSVGPERLELSCPEGGCFTDSVGHPYRQRPRTPSTARSARRGSNPRFRVGNAACPRQHFGRARLRPLPRVRSRSCGTRSLSLLPCRKPCRPTCRPSVWSPCRESNPGRRFTKPLHDRRAAGAWRAASVSNAAARIWSPRWSPDRGPIKCENPGSSSGPGLLPSRDFAIC